MINLGIVDIRDFLIVEMEEQLETTQSLRYLQKRFIDYTVSTYYL